MSIIDSVRELVPLIKATGNADLYGRVIDLEAEILALWRERMALEERLAAASRHAQIIQELTFNSPFYVRGGTELFCARCVEVDQRAVHVAKTTELKLMRRVYVCPECKRSYIDMRGM
ncbi:MAG TPA: hypothetical protein VGZ27_01580 [Vicinamibacterales bacterium]|jgi:hypothetical protein|nr:hypothetical protein [Vicinamibacterales bacterium]